MGILHFHLLSAQKEPQLWYSSIGKQNHMREEDSTLKTLQEMAFNFNKNILVSHTGGQLSSDGGLTLCVELMEKFQFTNLADKLLRLNDQRRYCQLFKAASTDKT